ncbi:MAG: polysaccharide deacetylase family protein [Pseudonocardia sp.]|nr:polysaccharide deacetylase family protein [Pseudonocardia sp.]
MAAARDHADPLGALVAAIALGVATFASPITGGADAPPAPAPVLAAAVAPRPVVQTDVPGGDTEPGARTVALTFDDGPDPRWTPAVVELLHRYGAVATFCMIGDTARGREDLVHSVVAAGMRLCDHTRTHDMDLVSFPRPEIVQEIAGTHDHLERVAGAPVRYFRAPGGYWSPQILDIAVEHGMQPLGWSVDSRDWQRPGVAAIVTTVQRQMHPGAVVLMHDGGGDRSQTLRALEQLLPWLVDHGYAFVFPDGPPPPVS